jgi:hypothetical protein
MSISYPVNEAEIQNWIFDFQLELQKILHNMTWLDTYSLCQILETEVWTFYKNNYDEDYKYPLINHGVSEEEFL